MNFKTRLSSKKVATIEARMSSSRLPGKIMKDILGKPLLERLVERIRRAELVDEVVVATTVNPQDDLVESWAKKAGISIYRGSEEDVLLRVLEAAKAFNGEIIIELTGDCPLLDPQIIDEVIRFYLHSDVDYASNIVERTYPRGLDVQIFSTAVLNEVNRLTQDPADHEHVSLYIYEHPERFKLGRLTANKSLCFPEYRLCVDTPEDFFVVESVYKELYLKNPAFNTRDVLHYLRQNPEIAQHNQQIQQKPVR